MLLRFNVNGGKSQLHSSPPSPFLQSSAHTLYQSGVVDIELSNGEEVVVLEIVEIVDSVCSVGDVVVVVVVLVLVALDDGGSTVVVGVAGSAVDSVSVDCTMVVDGVP